MIWKELAGALIRWLIVAIAGALVGRGVIGADLAQRIIEPATGAILGVIIFIIPVLWKIAKSRFDEKYREKLLQSKPSEKTKNELKSETWKENNFVLPI